MKDKRKKYEAIRNGIASGIYKCLRLVSIEDNERKVLLPFNQISKPGELELRLKHIQLMLEKELPSGRYQVECRNSHNKNGLVKSFDFEIKDMQMIKINPQGEAEKNDDGTIKTEAMAESISLHEYLDIMQENSDLKAENAMLKLQLEQAVQLAKNPIALNDAPPEKTGVDRVVDVLGDHLPSALALFDKLLTQRDRTLSLKENEQKKLTHTPKVKKRPKTMAEKLYEKKLVELQELYENDPDQADEIMNELEVSNPELYQMLCADLGLEEVEEDELEEEEEE